MSALPSFSRAGIVGFLGGFAVDSPIDGMRHDANSLGAFTGALTANHATLGLSDRDDLAGLSAGARARLDSMARTVRLDSVTRTADTLLVERLGREGAIRSRVDSAFRERGVARADSLNRIRRADSTATTGFHFARELEEIYAEVMRTPFPAQDAWSLFPRRSINPGAKRHGFRRITRNGDATIPDVGASRTEVLYDQSTIVTSFGWDIFEAMTSEFANSNYVAEGMRAAQETLMELGDHLIWNGSAVNRFYGVLNTPRLPRIYSSTPFDGTASVDDVLAALNRAANYSRLASKGALKPDSVIFGDRVASYLAETRLGTPNDTTILEYWLRTNSAGIRRYQTSHHLDGTLRNGRSGILFYVADASRGIGNAVGADFTMLPPQQAVFSNRVYCYMRLGGVVMPDVGNQCLLEVVTQVP